MFNHKKRLKKKTVKMNNEEMINVGQRDHQCTNDLKWVMDQIERYMRKPMSSNTSFEVRC